MGKRTPIRPGRTANLAALIAAGERVRASCGICNGYRDVDLAALVEAKGAAFDLWGKRPRCRFTDGCPGRVLFMYGGHCGFRPMKDD